MDAEIGVSQALKSLFEISEAAAGPIGQHA